MPEFWSPFESNAEAYRSMESVRQIFKAREFRKQSEIDMRAMQEKILAIESAHELTVASLKSAQKADDTADDFESDKTSKDLGDAAGTATESYVKSLWAKQDLYMTLLGSGNPVNQEAAQPLVEANGAQIQNVMQHMKAEEDRASEYARQASVRYGVDVRADTAASERERLEGVATESKRRYDALHVEDQYKMFDDAAIFAKAMRLTGRTDEETAAWLGNTIPQGAGGVQGLLDRKEGISEELRVKAELLRARIRRAEAKKAEKGDPEGEDSSYLKRLRSRLVEAENLDDAQDERNQEWDDLEMDVGLARRRIAEWTSKQTESFKGILKAMFDAQFKVPKQLPSTAPVAREVREAAESEIDRGGGGG